MVVDLSVHLTDTCERMMVVGCLRMPFHPFPRSELRYEMLHVASLGGFRTGITIQVVDSGSSFR